MQNPYAAPAAEEASPLDQRPKFEPTRAGWGARAAVVLTGLGHAVAGVLAVAPALNWVGVGHAWLGVAAVAAFVALPFHAIGMLLGLGAVMPFFYDLTKNAHALGLKSPSKTPAAALIDFIPPFSAWLPTELGRDLARGLEADTKYPVALANWWNLWLVAIGSYFIAPFLGWYFGLALFPGAACGVTACVFAFRVFWNLEMGMRAKAGLRTRRLI
ncbi:MAG: hypothetical protein AB7S68_06870 [Polyangiaceae bacterium]